MNILVCAYLAGIFDGEGTIQTNRKGRSIEILSNRDARLIMTVKVMVESLGFKPKIYTQIQKYKEGRILTVYRMRIFGRSAIEQFGNLILPYVQSSIKKEKILALIKTYQ